MKRNGAEEEKFSFGDKPPEVVTFNLQGTHKYTISKSNLEKFPDTLLAKMVFYNKNKEHFISQDGELFRYICMFYNLNILVDYREVGVPECVWEAYVDYFGLLQTTTSEKRLKVNVKPEYREIVNHYKAETLKERNYLVEIAIEMLTWMLKEDELECDFFEFAPEDQGGKVPDDIVTLYEFYPNYRSYYKIKDEHLYDACNILGLVSVDQRFHTLSSQKWWKYPASYLLDFRKQNGMCVHFTVKIKVI